MSKGYIHLYFGEGKGKTTAAMGLAIRSAGNGNRVLVVQFLKGLPSGEVPILESIPGISLMRGNGLTKFTWEMTEGEKEETRQQYEKLLKAAIERVRVEDCALLVLDEAMGACHTGLLNEKELLQFLRNKPEGLEVVLTGRDPSGEILSLADYATEMKKIKHPYDRGTPARKGIEF